MMYVTFSSQRTLHEWPVDGFRVLIDCPAIVEEGNRIEVSVSKEGINIMVRGKVVKKITFDEIEEVKRVGNQ